MRRAFPALLQPIALLCATASAALQAGELYDLTHTGQSHSGTGHAFVCCDYTAGQILFLSDQGKIVQAIPAKHGNDLNLLPAGHLLFNDGDRVREVDAKGRTLFEYKGACSIQSCQRLPDGNTLVAECETGRLLEIRPDGSTARSLTLSAPGTSPNAAFLRCVRKTPHDTYLVAHYGLDRVSEYSADGQLLRSIPAPGGPHSLELLPNGHLLISTADHPGGPRLFEVDKEGALVWELREGELPGVSLKFIAGFQVLKNGHLLLCNWLGHHHLGEAPQLIEITRSKELIWTFAQHDKIKTIANVRTLDEPND